MIILKDILKLNPFVTLIDLDVRDAETRLLKHVVIGTGYTVSPFQREEESKGKFEYINVDINKYGRVDKRGYSEMAYDIDWKAIPAMYLDMEVDMINQLRERWDRYGVNRGSQLRATVIPRQMSMDCAWR